MNVGKQKFYGKHGMEHRYDILKVIKSDDGIYIIKNYFKYFEIWKVVTKANNNYASKFICKKYNLRDCMRTIKTYYLCA